MRHFFSTKVRVVLILAVILAVVLALITNLTGMSLGDLAVKGILQPLRTGASKLTVQAEQLYSYIFRYEALAAENDALKEQIANMEAEARQFDFVSRENDRLRALLELTETNESYELVDAYIISWSSNDWSNTFTINRGTNSGIEEQMVAITANGEVVGLVDEVGTNYAVIKTVLDSSLEISSTISSSGYNGMVKGGYTTGLADLLLIDYLPTSAVIRNNDQVVTSGSTVYPRNLIVGYVIDAGFNDTGVAKFAVLEPAAEIENLEQVFILTAYDAG